MIVAISLAWLAPMLIGLAMGLWFAKRPATSPAEFGMAMVYCIIWAGAGIFAVHMLWLGAVMMNDGGVAALGSWAWYWTWITAMVWVPIMVIAYIVRAKRVLNS